MATPGTPTISATYISDGNIQLRIDNGAGVAPTQGYFVSRWNQADNTWGGETRYDYTSTQVIFTDPAGTTGNRKYRWRVRGKVDGNYSGYSYTDYVQTSPRAPYGASAGLSGPGAINFTWTDNAYAPYYDYNTQVWWNINGGGWGHLETVGASTQSRYFSGLTPGATYQFAVRHVETYGSPDLASDFSYSGVVQAIDVPPTPGTLNVSRVSDTQMSLSWTNNSNGGAPYDSLTLQRWDSVGNSWSTIANLGGGSTSVTDTGTVAGRKYQYRIAANNGVGSSGWSTSAFIYTTPDAPINANAQYTGGTSISVSWTNKASYAEQSVRVQAYKGGVADGAVVSLTGSTTSYTKTGVDITATYYFKVWSVSDVGALTSAQAQSNSVMAATAPNAPTGLTSSATVIDKARPHSISWTHSPSVDGSAQTKYQIRHRVSGSGTWTTDAAVTSTASTASNPFSGYTNGQVIEWQVATWGVHANPSPFSASATQQTSTTPTVNVTSPGATINTSSIPVAWSYYDAESTAQAEWSVELYESSTGELLEQQSGANATASITLAYSATDGATYRVQVKVRDGSGLWSDVAQKTFTAAFTPPAEVLLNADLDESSGSVILSLERTPDDGGATTFPASAVTIERQFYDPEIEDFGPWETLVAEASPDALLIDTTAPIHDDGQYRIITHSSAPSTYRSSARIKPFVTDHRWLYVSGGDNFDVVCRMWANIEIEWKASRNRALHYFAERRRPVIYSGEASEKVLSVSGLIDDESSPPQQWLRLAQQPGPVLLRSPGQRIFGNLSEVSVQRIQRNLHKVSFSIQEVGR